MQDTARAPQPPTNPPTGHQMSRQGLAQNEQKCQFWQKILIFPGEIKIFVTQSRSLIAQGCPKLALLVNLGQAMQAYLVPCWWVGWWLWRVGCISQDTYLLYMYISILLLALYFE